MRTKFKREQQKVREQRIIDAFNSKFKPGDAVVIKDDRGNEIIDIVRIEASLMGGHTAVAWLEKKGCYSIERVLRVSEKSKVF